MNTYEQIRETLVTIRALATCGGSDFGNPAIRGLLDQMDTIRTMAQSALAIPPRNCDVGTVLEQTARFNEFCNVPFKKWLERGNIKLDQCSFCELSGNRKCAFTWEQMPYKEGNAK